jgi:hypothetical protein
VRTLARRLRTRSTVATLTPAISASFSIVGLAIVHRLPGRAAPYHDLTGLRENIANDCK